MEKKSYCSIIIPVYNVRPYLKEALDSVIRQTYKKLEIIIIDDGSTDGSSEICDEYAKKDERIRIVHQENRGLSAARNAGLSLCSGEFIAFLDPDDKFRLDFCQKMLDCMEKHGADLVICRTVVSYASGIMSWNDTDITFPAISQGAYSRPEALRKHVAGFIDPSVWNKMYRSSLWKGIRFPDGHVYEDLDTTHKIIDRCRRVCVLDETLHLMRRRHGSITNTSSQKNINDYMLACHHLEAFVAAHIPSIFTTEHLKKVRKAEFEKILVFYIRLSRSKRKEEKAYLKALRKRIIVLGKEVGIRNCAVLVKIGYLIIRVFPGTVNVFSAAHYCYARKSR